MSRAQQIRQIEDSEPEDSPELTLQLIQALEKKKKGKRKHTFAYKELHEIPIRKKTRNHGFYQRHVYTTDLAVYLNLTTKEHLELLSKKGTSDERIEYMLNRKYVKLRRFFEKHEIKKHRYRKHDFSTYLEDFKRYQASSHKPMSKLYEFSDDNLANKKEKRQLLKLQKQALEKVVTTDEEVEEETPDLSEVRPQVGLAVDDVERGNQLMENQVHHLQEEFSHAENIINEEAEIDAQVDSAPVGYLVLSQENYNDQLRSERAEITQENPEEHQRAIDNRIPDSQPLSDVLDLNIPQSPLIASQILVAGPISASTQITDFDFQVPSQILHNERPPIEQFIRRRRTRQHKFTQDHVYVTDTAIYLGLSSSYSLNEMYENGKNYNQIVDYLEEEYQKKRKEREKKEIGLGPFKKSSFHAYINESPAITNKANSNQKEPQSDSINRDFLTSDSFMVSSDEEYKDDNSLTQRGLSSSQQPIDDQDLVNSDLDRDDDDDDESEEDRQQYDTDNRETFVFRKKVLQKEKALRGVLPKSFLRLENPKGKHVQNSKPLMRQPDRPGLAKRKKKKLLLNDQNENWEAFLASDNEQIESIKDDDDPAVLYSIFNRNPQQPQSNEFLPAGEEENNEIIELLSESDDEISDSEEMKASPGEDGNGGGGIEEYDKIIREMKTGFLTDIAEEDAASGIDYMLAPQQRKYGVSSGKRQKSSPGINRSTRFNDTSGRTWIRRPVVSTNYPFKNNTLNGSKSKSGQHTFDKSIQRSSRKHAPPDSSTNPLLDLDNNNMALHEPPRKYRDHFNHAFSPVNGQNDLKPSITAKYYASKQQNYYSKENIHVPSNRVLGTAQLEIERTYIKAPNYFQKSSVKPTEARPPVQTSSGYQDTIKKIERDAFRREREITPMPTLSTFENAKLTEKSFSRSSLFKLCLNPDFDLEYEVPVTLLIEFGNVRVTIHPGNITEAPQLVDTLINAVISRIAKPGEFSRDDVRSIRKLYVGLAELIWMIEDSKLTSSFIKSFARSTKRVIETFQLNTRDSKLVLLILPFHQLIVHTLSELSDQGNEQESWERLVILLERHIVLHSCTMSRSSFNRCMVGTQGVTSAYLDSYTVFLNLSKNPWRLVTSLHKRYHFRYENVLNWLYFLHSQQPLYTDWEFFIEEIDFLSKSKDFNKWKLVFSSLGDIIKDLEWDFEEQLIIRMYRSLSTQRFDNVGAALTSNAILTRIPSPEIQLKDGCLDIYFKYLVLFCNNYLAETKRSVFLEKIIPVGDIKTCTLVLLRNRLNMLLLVMILFKCDLDFHCKLILTTLGTFGERDAYKLMGESISAILKVFVTEINKVPIGSLRLIPSIISAINEGRVGDYVVDSFRAILDSLEEYSNSSTDPKKLISIIELCSLFLRIRKCDFSTRLSKLIYRSLALIQHVFPKIKSSISDSDFKKSDKLRRKISMLIPELKNVIASEEINNEQLKETCITVWIRASVLIGTSVESIVYNEWTYFETEKLRTRYELKFYSSIIEEYAHINSLNSIRDRLLKLLLSDLPLLDIPSFYRFFKQLGNVEGVLSYIKFRNGIDPTKFAPIEFSQRKNEISIKILAKIIMDKKYGQTLINSEALLGVFLKNMNEEYKSQKSRHLRYLQYREYCIGMIRYLSTVAHDIVGSNPDFIDLATELNIQNTLAPLHERVDVVASIDDLILLVEKEYIKSILSDSVSEFRTELKETMTQVSSFKKSSLELYTKSVFYTTSIIILNHLHTMMETKNDIHWIFLQFWMNFLSSQLQDKGFIVAEDVACIIRLLMNFDTISSSHTDPYKFAELSVYNSILDILHQLGLHLRGFEDSLEFRSILPVLAKVVVKPDFKDAFMEKNCTGDMITQIDKRCCIFNGYNPQSLSKGLKHLVSLHEQLLIRVMKERDLLNDDPSKAIEVSESNTKKLKWVMTLNGFSGNEFCFT